MKKLLPELVTSFEVAMNQMGGHAIFMDSKLPNHPKQKSVMKLLLFSGYCDFILARLKDHDNLLEMGFWEAARKTNNLKK